MKIVTVLGARPQFIKAATVSRALKKSGIDEVIIHTGQHYDQNMSQVFFDEMEIPLPDYNLEVQGLIHGAMTGRMLEKIEEVLVKEKPDQVLVYGDTNSTLAGALAAVKLHIPVAHVEAGLRSHDMKMPEEVNRILTDRISKVLFCPTLTAMDNLEKEGYKNFNTEIILSGDVMYDAVLFYRHKIKAHSTVIQKENLEGKPFVLVTFHRAENTDDPIRLKAICDALNEIQREQLVVLPLHPRSKSYLNSQHMKLNVKVIDPVGYFDMLALLENCSLVMTDSGGLQKEAYFFNRYCITLRDQTEWVELVHAGANSIVGADKGKILATYHVHKDVKLMEGKPLYGDGDAAGLVARHFA
ncbi:MAG: UDP-N-acetylglucosamine 2-epimerase (non-hydrolyzing) [Bacteroidota bacterium]